MTTETPSSSSSGLHDLWLPDSEEADSVKKRHLPTTSDDPSLRHWMVWLLAAVACVLGTVLGHYLLPYAQNDTGSQTVSSDGVSKGSGPSIVVDVHGDVNRPGTYTLAASARVRDAVKAAGGYNHPEDAGTVNSAAPLDDGAEVVIPNALATTTVDNGKTEQTNALHSRTLPGGVVARLPNTSAPYSLIDLNAASLQTLETLPGIGPARAQDILDYRQKNGAFQQVDELKNVHGIGPTLFARISPYVVVTHA